MWKPTSGRFDEAIPLLDGAIAVFGDLGARWELADAMAERGVTKHEMGLLDEAEEDLQRADPALPGAR